MGFKLCEESTILPHFVIIYMQGIYVVSNALVASSSILNDYAQLFSLTLKNALKKSNPASMHLRA